MRRNEEAVTDEKQIEAFIAGEQILRIAFYDHEELYIVPVNYGCCLENGKYTFYFHGAKAGRKYELIQSEPAVGFEIDGKYRLVENELPCRFSASFQSVTGTGTVRPVLDPEERRKGLNAIMRQVSGKGEWDYPEKTLDAVAVFRLDVGKFSCKAK